jgi:nucleotide-binding universal stress UspA family protein
VNDMANQAAPETIPRPSQADGAPGGRTTLVAGLDGSDTSWSALWWTCGEAQRLGARVIAVYVTCSGEAAIGSAALTAGFDAGAYTAAVSALHVEQAIQLQAEIQRRAGDLDVEIGFEHLEGDTAEQLMRVARDAHADLIAVGRSTKLRHRLAGSLGRRLARNKKAPIVVIVP